MMIDVARQFSPYPSGRFESDGSFNGQKFRTKFLEPALQAAKSRHDKVIVDIDGVRTFGSSFLEEAFAGLIRLGKFSREDLSMLLEVRCTKPHLFLFRDSITNLIKNATPEKAIGPG